MDERRTKVAVGAAVVVAASVTAAILAFGVRWVPSYPSLAEAPLDRLTGQLAYLSNRESTAEGCATVLDLATGQHRDVVCEPWAGDSISNVTWAPDGRLAVTSFGRAQARVRLYDADSATLVDELDVDPSELGAPRIPGEDRRNAAGDVIVADNDGGTVVIRVQGTDHQRELFRLRGPRDYSVYEVRWSPDGAWILFSDSANRTLIAPADGTTDDIRVVVEEASVPAWFDPAHPPVLEDTPELAPTEPRPAP